MTPQQTQSGDYLVLGKDAAEVEDDLVRLVSAHWDYIDRFAHQLVARGPLLSSDGERHMGSVHIITTSSALDAQRFAKEEPYHQANLYSSVTVTRFRNLLRQTMWERAPPIPPEYSTFMLASWPMRSYTANQIERLQAVSANKSWVFLGLLLSTDDECTGVAAAADFKPAVAERESFTNCLNAASCIQIRLNSAAGSEVGDKNRLE